MEPIVNGLYNRIYYSSTDSAIYDDYNRKTELKFTFNSKTILMYHLLVRIPLELNKCIPQEDPQSEHGQVHCLVARLNRTLAKSKPTVLPMSKIFYVLCHVWY
uniref:Large ribosomal subunit protein mL42 n=1 Tax=Xenopus tropicalis TaxID=8364 RepID=A0A803JZR2_XENTR